MGGCASRDVYYWARNDDLQIARIAGTTTAQYRSSSAVACRGGTLSNSPERRLATPYSQTCNAERGGTCRLGFGISADATEGAAGWVGWRRRWPARRLRRASETSAVRPDRAQVEMESRLARRAAGTRARVAAAEGRAAAAWSRVRWAR